MGLLRHVEKLTKTKSLFRDRKRSTISHSSEQPLSFGNRRSVSEVVSIPFLELLDGGVPWDGCPIQLQLMVPCWILKAHLGHGPTLLAFDQGSPSLVLSHPWKLEGNLFIIRDQLPFLDNLIFLLSLLQIGRREGIN